MTAKRLQHQTGPVTAGRIEVPPGGPDLVTARDGQPGLRALSLRCVQTEPHFYCQWHTHPFHEMCLTTDGTTLNGMGGELVTTRELSLAWFQPGTEHGYWNNERQRPRFWVVHFEMDGAVSDALPALTAAGQRHRRLQLTPAQAETFKWLFMRLTAEHSSPESASEVAESGWLRVLLSYVHRWVLGAATQPVAPAHTRPGVLLMWHAIQDCSGRPAEVSRRLRAIPGYDSLRQEFSEVFGCSPNQMALRTRIQIARNLLVETPLSIKQIAEQLGYVRQHEFTRAFHRETGKSPSDWRRSPA
jgi:AraC-like DNA-binding protein/quercetin dioxygenase-like cupin family protein